MNTASKIDWERLPRRPNTPEEMIALINAPEGAMFQHRLTFADPRWGEARDWQHRQFDFSCFQYRLVEPTPETKTLKTLGYLDPRTGATFTAFPGTIKEHRYVRLPELDREITMPLDILSEAHGKPPKDPARVYTVGGTGGGVVL